MSSGNFKDPTQAVYRYLTDDGLVADATNWDMAVDGTTPVPYYYTATAPTAINRIIFHVVDDGTWTEEKFGSLAALTNGMDLVVERNGSTVLDLFGGVMVKNNASWARSNHDRRILTVGSGDTMLTCRYTFGKSGQPILLRDNDSIKMTVSDNLSTLVEMSAMIQGYVL